MCLSIKVRKPECVLSEGEHAGHEMVTVHNTMGYRCGYVKVEPGHPGHGKNYEDIDASVHGGLTFAEPDLHCGKGGADNGWWVGFDCAHSSDLPDPDLPSEHPEVLSMYQFVLDRYSDTRKIRTQEYVEAQCRDLCEQAANANNDTDNQRNNSQEFTDKH